MRPSWLISGTSLRLKFAVPISIMVVISTVIMSGYLIDQQSDSIGRELESRAETLIRMIAINAESGVLFESKYELDELLRVLYQFESVEYCRITNTEGVLLSSYGEMGADATEVHDVRLRGRNQAMLVSDYVLCRIHNHLMYVQISPITTEKKQLSRETLGMAAGVDKSLATPTILETIGFIELGMSTRTVDRDITQAKTAAILLTLMVVVTTIIVVVFTVKAVTKSLTELVKATDHISRGDFDTRVKIDQQDEIGHLARTVNRMAESLLQSREEIEKYNRTLEEKIIERTQQLEDAQAQLIQSEKMSAIGQLAAGVAHELNNPLGGILGYAQFTLEKLRKNVPGATTAKEIDAYIRHVRDIENQARRCKTIVQNLLRFSRSSRGVEFEEVDVNRAIKETATFVEHQLQINRVHLDISLAPDLPHIYGNAGQLQQVFTNLIINAMHASGPDSVITVRSKFSPALGEFGGAIELVFSDNGHGIPKENLNKVFEPFFTTKEVGKGTGLGLSVSYGIIKEHGGEITVESEPEMGTTFTIVLPAQESCVQTDNLENKDRQQTS
ncbi:MAG: hypothetical protein DRP45_01015 [Candidatus Zixiibacteriota bacterium]|nr:MAG: hypothetical protein DRP45_01015 [candidate division Zixibacteria bacterium]